MKFFADISLWWLIPWALFCALLAWWYYRKQRAILDASPRKKVLLRALRAIGIFVLGLLLVGLLIEDIESKSQRPVLITLVDNSVSMLNYSDSSEVQKRIDGFQKQLKAKYGDRFDIVEYSIGTEFGKNKGFNENGSNLDKAFERIYTDYYNQNIGGICFISDGNYNVGGNPIYSSEKIALTPIFSVGVGDTIKKKDQLIRNVSANEIAFYKNQFPVEIDIKGIKTGKISSEVSIYAGGKKIQSQLIEFENGQLDFEQVTMLLDANAIGFVEYTVEIKPISNESSYENNKWSFYVEVIDSRSKVLMLSGAPHPDVSAIKNVIEKDENVEVESKLARDFEGKLDDYALLIWHDPGSSLNIGLVDEIKRSKIPTWYVLGPKSNQTTVNKLEVGIKLPRTGRLDDAQVSLKRGFQLFETSQDLDKATNYWPPLKVPFGGVNTGGYSTLLTQRIGPVVKDDAVWTFGNGVTKSCVVIGEGLWRWKLSEYARTKDTKGFNEIIQKTTQYLLVKRNTDALRVTMPHRFTINEDVIINAEFYNSSFEQITDPDISYKLKDEEGRVVNHSFAKIGSAYRLVLGKLPAGQYEWSASTTDNGKKFEKSGIFVVSDVSLEHIESSANHQLLNQLAENSNGKFYRLKNINSLVKDINKRDDIVNIHYEESTFRDIVDYSWLFVLLILSFGLEWFIRRRSGTY